jgi:hypothetical protein
LYSAKKPRSQVFPRPGTRLWSIPHERWVEVTSRYTGRNRRPKDEPNAVMSPDESDVAPDNDMR